jgi:hypothetical protein
MAESQPEAARLNQMLYLVTTKRLPPDGLGGTQPDVSRAVATEGIGPDSATVPAGVSSTRGLHQHHGPRMCPSS